MAGKKDVTAYKRPHKLKYGKWGLIFILPFFICYGIFQLYPLIATFYRSFFHDKTDIFLNSVFEFAGFENYIDLFTKYDIVKYFGNTMLLWLLGFIPQIIVSLLFASWFTDIRLKLKGTGAVKVILYLPNMLMASSIAVLFGKLFAVTGPINHILGTSIHFLENEWGIRLIIAFINFLMWTGNTTILLMAGIMGIDPALYEASAIDGASAKQQFRWITMPMLKPIMLYVMITSMIGGLQLFDIPNLIVNRGGTNGVLVCIICIFPFVMLLVNTTKDTSTLKTTFSLLPGGDFVRNFTNAINETKVAVLHSMFNSLIVAVISCVTSVYIATLTAYGLYAYNFRLKKAAFVFIMVILMVPTQVSALGFVEMMDAWGIKDSFIPLIFPTLASPAVFFFIKQYMESSLPLEIVEAGRIDGGHEFYIFNFVVMPILKPALAVQMIFQFVASWNNYFLPQLLMDNSSENATLPLVVASLQAEAYLTDLGEIYMILGFAIIPLIVVYLCLSKFIIRGVALGSVKG